MVYNRIRGTNPEPTHREWARMRGTEQASKRKETEEREGSHGREAYLLVVNETQVIAGRGYAPPMPSPSPKLPTTPPFHLHILLLACDAYPTLVGVWMHLLAQAPGAVGKWLSEDVVPL